MSGEFIPTDQANRQRIEESLDENLFAEAGAGTGKTTSLVKRIVALIKSGRTTVDSIAAITFTDAAAAELRDRVRGALETRARDTGCSDAERACCLRAAQTLDGAAIQTLHSFAGRLLRERPLDAGLPPAFDVVEAIEADLLFEERWQKWIDEALESEMLAPFLRLGLHLGLRLSDLRTVAKGFHSDYDLLTAGFASEAAPRREAARQLVREAADITRLTGFASMGPEDPLAAHASRVASLAGRLQDLGPDTDASTILLSRWGKLSFSKGSKTNWLNDPESGKNACTLLKGILYDLESLRAAEIEATRRALLLPLLEALRNFVLGYVAERRRLGKAEFHDLLVWTRNMLRDNREARRYFQQRFTHILIDEFQDTDPIQAEIAFLLAWDEPAGADPGDSTPDWGSMGLVPGKLFVVGDPKQSIYRFRRADIASLEKVRSVLGAGSIPLIQNFRSQEPIISWCNSVFSQWMIDDGSNRQATYIGLAPRWKLEDEVPAFGVHWLGGAIDGRSAEARRREARDIASLLLNIKQMPWKVRHDDQGTLRDARFQDICILLPTRTGLRDLENALDSANVPYRVESQSMVLATNDVRELLNCLRAIDAPADQVALVAALRSSAFACSDVELLEFVEAGGRLDYLRPGTADGPVRAALEVLEGYHRQRLWCQPDELIESFVRGRAMVEACFIRARPRERWRRLRFVIDRARAFGQVGGSSLRAFLDWMERQAEEGARMVEVPVPETDEDAVRIMTIHAAKGLEFPIVIMAGLGHASRAGSAPVIFDRHNSTVEVRFGRSDGSSFKTAGYEDAKESDKRADEAEGVRLMYVAATRARDHLVLSLFRPVRGSSDAQTIEGLASKDGSLWHKLEIAETGRLVELPGTPPDGRHDEVSFDREQWQAQRDRVIRTASRPAAWAVTTLTGMAKDEAEGGEEPHRRGRAGTSLGRAVHSVLQSVDLATGAGLEDISRAQAAAEEIPDRWQEVARLARRGLESSVVKRAVASGRYHREVFISTHLAGALVEGFIDLLFEDDGGLVVADYKTDAVDGNGALVSVAKGYEMQAGLYALAIEQVTGKPVKEVVLVFVHAAEEVRFADVASLQARARGEVERVLAST